MNRSAVRVTCSRNSNCPSWSLIVGFIVSWYFCFMILPLRSRSCYCVLFLPRISSAAFSISLPSRQPYCIFLSYSYFCFYLQFFPINHFSYIPPLLRRKGTGNSKAILDLFQLISKENICFLTKQNISFNLQFCWPSCNFSAINCESIDTYRYL